MGGRMSGKVNLLKLCVGADSVEDLAAWQDSPRARGADGRIRHVTRMWPRRAEELLDGGSLYWVIRGVVLVRQRLLALEPVTGADGTTRCALILDETRLRTAAQPRRPFQGWRYLEAADAPADLSCRQDETPLPPHLSAALAEIGVL